MKNTIKTIALSVAFLSGTGMVYAEETEVTVNSGLQETLAVLSQQVENGTALNLAINTGDINASVNTDGGFDTVNTLANTIETTAIGAANTGSISIEQGSLNTVITDTVSETHDYQANEAGSMTDNLNEIQNVSELSETYNSVRDTNYSEEVNKTLSNYNVANVAFNSGAIDASVNTSTSGAENNINGITTSAIGAVNTGTITVSVK